MEIKRNKDKYSSFLVSTNIDKDVKKYLLEKKYSSEIGDIIINVLANSTFTEAYIYKRNQSNEYIQTNFIEPREPAINGDIHLLRTGEHYHLLYQTVLSSKVNIVLTNNLLFCICIIFEISYFQSSVVRCSCIEISLLFHNQSSEKRFWRNIRFRQLISQCSNREVFLLMLVFFCNFINF